LREGKLTAADRILQQFRDLNVWRRADERAPHKPLLVLLALAKLQAGAPRLTPFDEVEIPLSRLLEDFGPPRKSVHPELPFFHLQTDGIWEIHDDVGLTTRRGSKNPLRSELRKFRIGGGFTSALFEDLRSRPEVVREVAREILTGHFPESLHESICEAVGLDLSGTARSAKRDGSFRDAVVSVWDHSCAFCGYSVQLDRSDLGLEAAHIRWVQFGGPDVVNNGLACCSIHHLALDRGAISVSDDGRVLVSSRVYGGSGLESNYLAIHGSPLREPNQKRALPKSEFLAWHRKEVFRGEARDQGP
jgi:putative restriction endonuclease